MAASTPPPADDLLAHWVRDHARAVRGFLLGIVRRADLADDLLQETFVRAWQARDRYEPRGQDRAWLLRIADNLACDHLRRRRREVNLDGDAWQMLEPVAAEPVDLPGQDELGRQLGAALEELSEPQRRVLLLRYYGELDFATIAHTLGSPLGTVLSHCHRGLAALRKRLAPHTS